PRAGAPEKRKLEEEGPPSYAGDLPKNAKLEESSSEVMPDRAPNRSGTTLLAQALTEKRPALMGMLGHPESPKPKEELHEGSVYAKQQPNNNNTNVNRLLNQLQGSSVKPVGHIAKKPKEAYEGFDHEPKEHDFVGQVDPLMRGNGGGMYGGKVRRNPCFNGGPGNIGPVNNGHLQPPNVYNNSPLPPSVGPIQDNGNWDYSKQQQAVMYGQPQQPQTRPMMMRQDFNTGRMNGFPNEFAPRGFNYGRGPPNMYRRMPPYGNNGGGPYESGPPNAGFPSSYHPQENYNNNGGGGGNNNNYIMDDPRMGLNDFMPMQPQPQRMNYGMMHHPMGSPRLPSSPGHNNTSNGNNVNMPRYDQGQYDINGRFIGNRYPEYSPSPFQQRPPYRGSLPPNGAPPYGNLPTGAGAEVESEDFNVPPYKQPSSSQTELLDWKANAGDMRKGLLENLTKAIGQEGGTSSTLAEQVEIEAFNAAPSKEAYYQRLAEWLAGVFSQQQQQQQMSPMEDPKNSSSMTPIPEPPPDSSNQWSDTPSSGDVSSTEQLLDGVLGGLDESKAPSGGGSKAGNEEGSDNNNSKSHPILSSLLPSIASSSNTSVVDELLSTGENESFQSPLSLSSSVANSSPTTTPINTSSNSSNSSSSATNTTSSSAPPSSSATPPSNTPSPSISRRAASGKGPPSNASNSSTTSSSTNGVLNNPHSVDSGIGSPRSITSSSLYSPKIPQGTSPSLIPNSENSLDK
ncbi:Uncharacterized protein FKW44_013170, partial [Caligus rogercresseyi]